MGQEESRPKSNFFSDFPEQYQRVELSTYGVYGYGIVFRHLKTNELIIEKQYHIHNEFDENKFASRLCLDIPNVLTELCHREKENADFFGPVTRFNVYYEFLPHTLQQEIEIRRQDKVPFFESDIWFVLYQITAILKELKIRDLHHKDLRPQSVLMRPDGQIVLAPIGVFPDDRSGIKKALTNDDLINLPPGAIKEGQAKVSWQVIDIYALGVTILNMLSCQTRTFNNYDEIITFFQTYAKYYSPQLMALLESMVLYPSDKLLIEDLHSLLFDHRESIKSFKSFNFMKSIGAFNATGQMRHVQVFEYAEFGLSNNDQVNQYSRVEANFDQTFNLCNNCRCYSQDQECLCQKCAEQQFSTQYKQQAINYNTVQQQGEFNSEILCQGCSGIHNHQQSNQNQQYNEFEGQYAQNYQAKQLEQQYLSQRVQQSHNQQYEQINEQQYTNSNQRQNTSRDKQFGQQYSSQQGSQNQKFQQQNQYQQAKNIDLQHTQVNQQLNQQSLTQSFGDRDYQNQQYSQQQYKNNSQQRYAQNNQQRQVDQSQASYANQLYQSPNRTQQSRQSQQLEQNQQASIQVNQQHLFKTQQNGIKTIQQPMSNYQINNYQRTYQPLLQQNIITSPQVRSSNTLIRNSSPIVKLSPVVSQAQFRPANLLSSPYSDQGIQNFGTSVPVIQQVPQNYKQDNIEVVNYPLLKQSNSPGSNTNQ